MLVFSPVPLPLVYGTTQLLDRGINPGMEPYVVDLGIAVDGSLG